ncbi:hypothetical protein LY71_107105 [Geodermatophilus tzadiensis]|uniref:Uncharacterized protein n=1 Tax=Geodermatophilus tzadiensis TaxID=1137988 RepID=A0A2T0TTP9_9ACTN|nr:hypothetical protein LY71_107105 [Geodermatophilus tzadiensis]
MTRRAWRPTGGEGPQCTRTRNSPSCRPPGWPCGSMCRRGIGRGRPLAPASSTHRPARWPAGRRARHGAASGAPRPAARARMPSGHRARCRRCWPDQGGEDAQRVRRVDERRGRRREAPQRAVVPVEGRGAWGSQPRTVRGRWRDRPARRPPDGEPTAGRGSPRNGAGCLRSGQNLVSSRWSSPRREWPGRRPHRDGERRRRGGQGGTGCGPWRARKTSHPVGSRQESAVTPSGSHLARRPRRGRRSSVRFRLTPGRHPGHHPSLVTSAGARRRDQSRPALAGDCGGRSGAGGSPAPVDSGLRSARPSSPQPHGRRRSRPALTPPT